MSQEEQSKRLGESLDRLSKAWRNMGQSADAICESLKKLLKCAKKSNNGGQYERHNQ